MINCTHSACRDCMKQYYTVQIRERHRLVIRCPFCEQPTISADDDATGSATSGPIKGLRILVPNSPGSGYDTTARAAAKAMQDAKLTDTVELFNSAGAGGTVVTND